MHPAWLCQRGGGGILKYRGQGSRPGCGSSDTRTKHYLFFTNNGTVLCNIEVEKAALYDHCKNQPTVHQQHRLLPLLKTISSSLSTSRRYITRG